MATLKQFAEHISVLTSKLVGQEIDENLAEWLNSHYSPQSGWFSTTQKMCAAGIASGWMCAQQHGGIKYGRVIKPSPYLHGFSVDVVEMDEVAGPHHRHPQGEIDLIMPITGDARFDGHQAGWCVYPPDSAHKPTVSGGRAWVLYLLPAGAIEFTRT